MIPRFFPILTSRPNLLCLGVAASLLACSLADAGNTIICEGVLGNSGADGPWLVKGGAIDAKLAGRDLGLAYDHLGGLWTFSGQNTLLRLSLDGRLTGTYQTPNQGGKGRRLVLAENALITLIDGELYRLPIESDSGTSLTKINKQAELISLNAISGKIALIAPGKRVVIWDAVQNTETDLGEAKDDARQIDLLPDGSVVAGAWKYRPGSPPSKIASTLAAPHQLVGPYIYAFLDHMTLSRRDLDFAPAPGVVFGGSSGYFIGTLPEDGELVVPCGIALLGDNRFAVAGPLGVINLLEWDEEAQTFRTVRRIGSIHGGGPLALDQKGRVWFYSGYWEWNDSPEHILRSPIPFHFRDWLDAQAAVLPNGLVTAPFLSWTGPAMLHQEFKDGKRNSSSASALPANPTGLAILPEGDEADVLVVDAKGKGVRMRTDAAGKIKKTEAPVVLPLSSPSPSVTSLAFLSANRIAVADGAEVAIVAFENDTYREVARWKSWAAGQEFGNRIFLDGHGEFLWISDSERDRVLGVQVLNDAPASVTEFRSEALTTPLKNPGRISASNGRAVVIDQGNQRLLKLATQELAPPKKP